LDAEVEISSAWEAIREGLYLSLYCIEKGLWMTFLTTNAHNRMPDVTYHRNLETLGEGTGGKFQ
jgi:hypothetical protein